MQTFYNQAILSHNNIIRTSNIVTGIITDVISADKNANKDTYTHGDEITYSVALVNSGNGAVSTLTVTDDLGQYGIGNTGFTPLEYVNGSLLYYANGVLQPTPSIAVNGTGELVISSINIPAGGNGILIYTVRVNSFAPLGENGQITNTVTVSGTAVPSNITASETIRASTAADLAIVKSLTPSTLYGNGPLTYTFTVQNYGGTAVDISEDAIITDTFNPILKNISVTFNGEPWVLNENYTYNESTGLFATLPGNISVPAAVYSRDSVSGVWTVTPGTSTITVTGNI